MQNKSPTSIVFRSIRCEWYSRRLQIPTGNLHVAQINENFIYAISISRATVNKRTVGQHDQSSSQ